MTKRLLIFGGFLLCVIPTVALSQADSVGASFRAIARSTENEVMLRWAPTSLNSWRLHQPYGWKVERLLAEKDSISIEVPVLAEGLTPEPLLPAPLEAWESAVGDSKYAAIAAQALYGSSFELEIGENASPGVYEVYMKSQEAELRFGMHLLAADLSADVARLSGLAYTDENVGPTELYLYRIISQVPDSLGGGDTVLLLSGPASSYDLPPAPTPQIEANAGMISLTWNLMQAPDYGGYYIERSQDSLNWERTSDDPIFPLLKEQSFASPYQFQSATDSVAENSGRWYYRIVGTTPFGDVGTPSEVVSTVVGERLVAKAYWVEAESPDNQRVELAWAWDPPQEGVKVVVERANKNAGPYRVISDTLMGSVVSFTDPKAAGSNYYRLKVLHASGTSWNSMSKFVQLLDSVPPVQPRGVVGQVSEDGVVILEWTPNPDQDIAGYRIYRANFLSEEFSQVTIEPVTESLWYDTIPMATLTKSVYYKVMAIDGVGNGSVLSEAAALERPDVIPPVAPPITQYESTEEGVALAWESSPSDDVENILLYRWAGNERNWSLIGRFAPTDSTTLDTLIVPDMAYRYALAAIDANGNESEKSSFIQVRGMRDMERGKPELFIEVDRDRRRIRLGWSMVPGGIDRVLLYRAEGDQPMTQLTTMSGRENTFSDTAIILNTQYTYRIQLIYPDGSKSAFSKPQSVNY